MKYDLKAMDFDPDADDLTTAFTWEFTPEGSDYWARQYIDGITPEGQAKWDAMKQQWNEENSVMTRETGTARELNLQVGDVVAHGGSGAEYMVVDTCDGLRFKCVDSGGYGVAIEESNDTYRIVYRAKPLEDITAPDSMFPMNCRCATTPAQRYVVLTDGETLICTRSESEDLCATGGVDAVYKLGDKVSVTVKVELS